MSEKKKSGGALLGAAFLMATSAIGPGFLTQTATFTGQYQVGIAMFDGVLGIVFKCVVGAFLLGFVLIYVIGKLKKNKK